MKTNRLPRYKRVKEPPSIRLTPRDIDVIKAVAAYRALDREQIQALFFPSRNTANRRLVRLFQHGYLWRRILPMEYGQGDRPAVYVLDAKGVELIGDQQWTKKKREAGFLFLDHLLRINDVRIAFTLGARDHAVTVSEWLDEGTLKSPQMRDYVEVSRERASGKRKVAVIPDGYFILDLGDKRAHFFLEVDRGTIANKRWKTRVKAYQEYTKSGLYQKRYKTRSLRILTATTGVKRLANLKKTTEAAGGKDMFWFTTLDQATPDQVLTGSIWQTAGREGFSSLL